MREDRERVAALVIHPRARLLLPVFLLVLVALTIWRLTGGTPGGGVVELAGATMGTRWTLKLNAPELGAGGSRGVGSAVQATLDRVDALMTTWDPESEVSRLNRHAETVPFPVSPETARVLDVARQVSVLTGGAFDVTVRPIVSAWGFGATDRTPHPPTRAELDALRGRVGYQLLRLDLEARSVSKVHPDVECDLSAIAKGFGVDEVARVLGERGHGDFLIEVGGELRASGLRPDGRSWRVAIERPDVTGRAIHRVVGLSDRSLATSGDYRNYYERDGRRFSHLIDPRTAAPVAHGLASVSVIHPSATWADALATALSVLGPEEGGALAEREGLAVHFIVREKDGALRSESSSAFRALLGSGAEDEES
jgi:thiamine biosynthesis lipoprotein